MRDRSFKFKVEINPSGNMIRGWQFVSHYTSLDGATRTAIGNAVLWPTRIVELPSLDVVWES